MRFPRTRALLSGYKMPAMLLAVGLCSAFAEEDGEPAPCVPGADIDTGAVCAADERVLVTEYESSDSVRGYIVEIYEGDTERCDSFILLTGAHLWNRNTQAFLYGIGLLYCFLGVAIIADIFMAGIEVITSEEREIERANPVTGDIETVTVLTWNPTVANLSLMALGSSAPEILLAVIGTVSTLDAEPDELGPGTIVGSAAFNLLVITGICIVSIPNGEFRHVKETGVFAITATASIFSYVWLYIVLVAWTPDVVTPAEAWITLLLFPVLLVLAWSADNNWFRTGPNVGEAPDLGDTQLVAISIAQPGQDDLVADHDTIRALTKQIKSQEGSLANVDAATISGLVAKQERPPSRMRYRINAIRQMTGGRRAIPVKTVKKVKEEAKVEELSGVVFEFRSPTYAIVESGGEIVCTVVRKGVLDCAAEVAYCTEDGTATGGEDYVAVDDGKLVFAAGEETKELSITIIDDNEWEPDETFTVALSKPGATGTTAALGRVATTEVTILNDDSPGVLSFASAGRFPVKESEPFVELTVQRKDGSDGRVEVSWATNDGTALCGRDYQAMSGQLVFEHRECSQTIQIPIVDNDHEEETFNDFHVTLSNPQPAGAQLSSLKTATVTIYHDDTYAGVMDKVAGVMKMRAMKFSTATHSWREQFCDALTMQGEVTETGESLPPSATDFLMHFLTIFWKVIFAAVPPTDYYGGWATFSVALFFIGILTGIIGELAALFGCSIGLETPITAITFVALGTSLPDTFASKTAAANDSHADASIGNVTGSNSVNVLLGLGLPWVIATLYKGGDYAVPAGDLAYSVIIFTVMAVCCIATLVARRYFLGGELGGSGLPMWGSAVFCVTMWIVYVILVSIKVTSSS